MPTASDTSISFVTGATRVFHGGCSFEVRKGLSPATIYRSPRVVSSGTGNLAVVEISAYLRTIFAVNVERNVARLSAVIDRRGEGSGCSVSPQY